MTEIEALKARAEALLTMADRGDITISTVQRSALSQIARAAAPIDKKFLDTIMLPVPRGAADWLARRNPNAE